MPEIKCQKCGLKHYDWDNCKKPFELWHDDDYYVGTAVQPTVYLGHSVTDVVEQYARGCDIESVLNGEEYVWARFPDGRVKRLQVEAERTIVYSYKVAENQDVL